MRTPDKQYQQERTRHGRPYAHQIQQAPRSDQNRQLADRIVHESAPKSKKNDASSLDHGMPLTLSQSRRRFSLSRTIPPTAEANTVLTEFGRSRCVGASVEWNHQDEQRCVSQRSARIVNRNERVSVDPQNIGEIGCHGRDLSLQPQIRHPLFDNIVSADKAEKMKGTFFSRTPNFQEIRCSRTR